MIKKETSLSIIKMIIISGDFPSKTNVRTLFLLFHIKLVVP